MIVRGIHSIGEDEDNSPEGLKRHLNEVKGKWKHSDELIKNLEEESKQLTKESEAKHGKP